MRHDELGSVQFLRFVASTLVVLFHTEVQLFRLSGGARPNEVPFAAYGTDLFFVISGFIIVHITRGRKQTFTDFMTRRFRRIVPLYWIYTAALIVLWLVWRSAFNSTSLEFRHVLSSFLFIPYPHPVLGITQPLMPVGWTLNYYMYFYLVVALCLPLSAERRVAATSGLLLAMVALRLLIGKGSFLLDFYGSPIAIEFIFGMTAALLLTSVPRLSSTAVVVALAVSLAIFVCGMMRSVSEGNDRVVFWGGSAAFLLFGCVAYERSKGWKAGHVTQHLGDASYSIFLSNLFSLGGLGLLFRQLHLYAILGGEAVQILLLVGAIAAGYLAHVVIEKPLLKRLGQNSARRDMLKPVKAGC